MSGITRRRRQAELAQKILSHIRQERLEAGDRLRENQLASHLQVSRTPVRNALKLLEAQGIVASRPYHGYTLLSGSADLRSVALDVPKSHGDELYLKILGAHLQGELGDMFNQADLMRRFDTNAVTLQSVLSQMTTEGLIEARAGRGWVFTADLLTPDARRASYEYRRALEPTALRLPGFFIAPDVLADLEQQHHHLLTFDAHDPAPPTLLFNTDTTFHETLVEAGGNPLFLQAIQHQNRRRRMLEYLGYDNRRRVAAWCHEHLAVIEALKNGDIERAATRLTHHLDQAQDVAVALNRSAGETPGTAR